MIQCIDPEGLILSLETEIVYVRISPSAKGFCQFHRIPDDAIYLSLGATLGREIKSRSESFIPFLQPLNERLHNRNCYI